MPSTGERLKTAQAWHRHQNFVRMMEYLDAHPCADCGEHDPVVLDFDHLPGTDKRFEIARAVSASTRGWPAILQEIQKCEVVCANCHRRRTAARAGHRKHLLATGMPLLAPVHTKGHARVPHGGGAKGRRGCLCEPCRKRRNSYAREWRARSKGAESVDQSPTTAREPEDWVGCESDPQ